MADKTLFKVPEIDIETVEEKANEIKEKRIESNFDIDAQVRRAMGEAIKNVRKSRIIIAAEMSELLGVQISEHHLNSWTASSKEAYRMPAAYIPAFCEVTGDTTLLKIISAPLGVKVVENKDLMWLKYAKLRQLEKEIKAKKKAIEKRIMEGMK